MCIEALKIGIKEVILPQFLNIVYELGFSIDDLKL